MATKFGISELRSKFDDWRQGLLGDKEAGPDEAPSSSERYAIVDDLKGEDPKADNRLSVLIENLVIPKLMADRDNPANRISERGLAETIGTDRKRPITDEDVASFTALTLQSEASSLLDFVDNCLATGSSVEDIYIDLLAPSARRLGTFWEEDSQDFVEVTMALWRIQEVLRELALRVPPPVVGGQGQRSALFANMPGEQHSLGTLMVAECFQRAGWDTDVLIEPSQSELTAKFANSHYDLVGLTLSNDCPSSALSGLIKSIRSVSSNAGICVMIGGRFVNENPDLADECDADGTAADASSAIATANTLVPARASAPDRRT